MFTAVGVAGIVVFIRGDLRARREEREEASQAQAQQRRCEDLIMDLGLADRAFVVTAASSGLGRATAQQLVSEGARVVLVARRAEVLAEAVSRMGPDRAVALAADLTDPGTAESACALASGCLRPAGRGADQRWWPAGRFGAGDTSEEQWRSAFESVFLAALRVSRAVIRHGTASLTCASPGCCRPR